MQEKGTASVEREFTDGRGHRWRAAYSEGGDIKGLVTMRQVVFEAVDGERAGERRYISVYPGYLEGAEDAVLQVALGQAQPVDPPW